MPNTLKNNTWRKPRCWRSLVSSHVTSLWDHTFNTVRWHRAGCDDCFLLGLPKMDPVNSVLSVLPTCFVVNVSGLRQILKKSSISSFHGLSGVTNTVCRVSRPSRPPAMSLAFNRDVKLNEHPRWNTKLLPLARYEKVAQHLWFNQFSSRVPWVARMCNNLLQEFWQYWNLVLLLSFQMTLIQSLSVTLLPPALRNLHQSFGL